MTKYECCGIRFQHGQELTEHVRSMHNVGQFTITLSCCGVNFREAKQLREHVKTQHHAELKVET